MRKIENLDIQISSDINVENQILEIVDKYGNVIFELFYNPDEEDICFIFGQKDNINYLSYSDFKKAINVINKKYT